MDQQLSVSMCREMIKAGIGSVISQKDHLNTINVFPVPDGDTGTNMVATIKSLLPGIDQHDDRPSLLGYIQDTVLLSSRGNSGTVLSQRFQGRCNSLEQSVMTTTTNGISLEQFSEACHAGYQSALDSFVQPQTGTILDVMKIVSEIPIQEQYRKLVHDAAAQACMQTRLTMKQLRNKDVPDAGAVGFYQLIAGICSVMMDPSHHDVHVNKQRDSNTYDNSHDLGSAHHESVHHSMSYRYCTECVLQDSTRTVAQRKHDLEHRGDSLQIVGGNHHIKIHIHTDTPEDLMKLCEQYAVIVDFKSDDMRQMIDDHAQILRPVHAGSAAKVPLMLVVDSACDLAMSLQIKLPIMTIVTPIINQHDDQTVVVSSKQDLVALYDRMAGDSSFRPMTSQPSLYSCQQLLQQALQKAESVICISISSGLSGTYERICLAAKQLGGDQIHCIDSQTASAGMAAIVHQLDQLAQQGMATSEIVSHIRSSIMHHPGFACIAPASLKYLARGGRIGKGSYHLGRLVLLRPLLGLKQGRIVSIAKIPFATDQRMIQRILGLFEQYHHQTGSDTQLILTYTDDRSYHLLKVLKAGLLERYQFSAQHLHIVQMNPVIGAHVGPGTIGLFSWKR